MPVVVSNPVNPLSKRIARLQEILSWIEPIPSEWIEASASNGRARKPGGSELECAPCNSYRELVSAWKKAMKWTESMDCALSVMLASSMSTPFVGEQIWVKIIGPPSSGKTTIAEGLAVNKQYIISKDTIRGFHSGWSKKGEDGEDLSLIALARNKTLIVKDGDTLLKQPNLPQILAEGRGVYDRVSRTHYRNERMDDYEGLRMTWLLCGTSALREIDESELGTRFIDCVVMDTIDDEFEDDVAWRAANQEDRNMLLESNGDATTQYPPELAEAMQLSGGYVGYLRRHAVELSSSVISSEEALRRCTRLGKFVAFMRARPSKKQSEEFTREFSPRLVKLMVRLARALAVVLNKKSLDEEVLRRVTKVAFDTARGKVLDLVDHLYRAKLGSLEVHTISLYLNYGEEKLSTLLRFLQGIGVVEPVLGERGGVTSRWRLTALIRKLYHEVER